MSYFSKNNSFLSLTKTQKAALLSHLKRFVKKNATKNSSDILDEFICEEEYYKNVGNIHFEWIFDCFEQDDFLNEVKSYINFLLFEIEQKERQKPYIEAQKKKMKEVKIKAQEFKMSKLPPTKKQLYYYEKLCKKYKIVKAEISELSRLDLRNLIDEILINNEQNKL